MMGSRGWQSEKPPGFCAQNAAMTTTALLVIDLQRGAFDGVRCPPLDQPEHLIHQATRLIQAARDAGAPIVFIQHGEGPGHPLEEDSIHWQLHEALVPQPDDPIVRKQASSAFENTGLADTLAQLDARALVLCGLQSELCVSNTALAALALGYPVIVAQDAHGTWPGEHESAAAISERANQALAAAGARLCSTQDLTQAFPA